MTTEFSANVDRLILAQNALEAVERAERRAYRMKAFATVAIGAIIVFVIAYLVGVGFLYLMPVK